MLFSSYGLKKFENGVLIQSRPLDLTVEKIEHRPFIFLGFEFLPVMGRFTLVSFQNRALVNKTEHINVQGNTLSTSVVNTLPVVSFDSWNCRFTW